MEYRRLSREEIERLKEIDRSEIIEKLYYFQEGRLELRDEYYNVKNEWWIAKEVESNLIPRLYDLYDRGGTIIGALDGSSLAGMVAVDSKFIGKAKDRLKLDILFVSKNYRKMGVGRWLMALAIEWARELGASKLYISATPSQNTIDFYMRLGSVPTAEVDPELYNMEPEDIHLELKL